MSARDLTRLITSVTGDVVITQKIFSEMSLYLESKNLSTIHNTIAVGNKEAQIQEITSIGLGGISEKSGVSLVQKNAAEITCGVEKTAAKTVTELNGIGKTEIAIACDVKHAAQLCREATTSTEGINLIKSAIVNLDVSVGNREVLQKAVSILKDVPGAFGKDGTFTRLIECGNTADKLGTARGAAYEIEKAYELMKQGEKMIGLGNKIPLTNNMEKIIQIFDIDIETATKLIECKNWDWNRVNPDRISKLQSQLPQLRDLASSKGKVFEIYSKNSIPKNLKEWLIKQEIKFTED